MDYFAIKKIGSKTMKEIQNQDKKNKLENIKIEYI